MSNNELTEFIITASKSELMLLLEEISAAKLNELEDAIYQILSLL